MVLVAAGSYKIGSNAPGADDFSKPEHSVDLKAFYIDRTEVSNAEYKKFVDATGQKAPKGWTNNAPAAGTERLPVVQVTYADAEAYAKWAGKRLPTEAEWEAAARGTSGRTYPWGNEWNSSAGNIGKQQGSVEPVGSYPAGASECGALDMIGNAWEWTSSKVSAYPGSSVSVAEYEGKMVMRGSTYNAQPKHDATWRGFQVPTEGGPNLGFRCVKDAP
jgi:serine/threonine-protein kinase